MRIVAVELEEQGSLSSRTGSDRRAAIVSRVVRHRNYSALPIDYDDSSTLLHFFVVHETAVEVREKINVLLTLHTHTRLS